MNNTPGAEKFKPAMDLEGFFAGQFNFSPNTWTHLEFSVDTENLLGDTLFHEAPAEFQLDELSLTTRAKQESVSNYFSVYMGNYDPIGSDVFLRRYYGIDSIASRLTDSFLGLNGSLLYPHFGVGISDVIKFNSPITIGFYAYVNKEYYEKYIDLPLPDDPKAPGQDNDSGNSNSEDDGSDGTEESGGSGTSDGQDGEGPNPPVTPPSENFRYARMASRDAGGSSDAGTPDLTPDNSGAGSDGTQPDDDSGNSGTSPDDGSDDGNNTGNDDSGNGSNSSPVVSGKEYYVFNTDIRFACVYRYFYLDAACGLGFPIMKNEDNLPDASGNVPIVPAIYKIYWHTGLTCLIGNNFTPVSFFIQAGMWNLEFTKLDKLEKDPKKFFVLIEPRFNIMDAKLHMTFFSLPEETLYGHKIGDSETKPNSNMTFIDDTLGFDVNFFMDDISLRSSKLSIGTHVTMSFPDKTLMDIGQIGSFFKEDWNLCVTPYVSTNIFSGEINLLTKLNIMALTRKEAHKAFNVSLGYKTQF